MKQEIIFAARDTPGQYKFFATRMDGGEVQDADLAKYGIEIHYLTPRINKTDFGFRVTHQRKSWRGHISTHGDFIVRVPQ